MSIGVFYCLHIYELDCQWIENLPTASSIKQGHPQSETAVGLLLVFTRPHSSQPYSKVSVRLQAATQLIDYQSRVSNAESKVM